MATVVVFLLLKVVDRIIPQVVFPLLRLSCIQYPHYVSKVVKSSPELLTPLSLSIPPGKFSYCVPTHVSTKDIKHCLLFNTTYTLIAATLEH
jgi:hypothetical protein